MDLAGICIMIMSSSTAPFYYGLMCHEWGLIWLVQVWVVCLIAFAIVMLPTFQDFKYKWVLSLAFIIAGYSTVPGMLHAAYYLPEDDIPGFDMMVYLIGGTIYAVGAVFYAARFPERNFPRIFDYIGNSHNIFHTACVIGASMHWYGAIKTFHLR